MVSLDRQKEEEYFKRLQQGDIRSFEYFFKEYTDLLYAYALGFVKEREPAEDIIQDTFVYFWNNRERIRYTGSVYAYLQTSVRNACINYREHEKVEHRYEQEILHTEEEAFDWQEVESVKEMRQKLLDAIDRLRDTSSSHQRISIVEIMGRHCSDLTISAGIAGGCEYIVASEVEFNREELIRQIERSIIRGKRHAIIAITELITDVHSLAREIEARVGHETRATVLGHIQRGGSPCAFDRILGSRMGVYAVDILLQGKGGYCVGIQNEKLVHHDIIDAINNMRREFKADWLEMAKRLE